MAFDIYQKIVDEDGEPIEKKAGAYRQQLFELFVESPEGQALIDEGIQPGWADPCLLLLSLSTRVVVLHRAETRPGAR